MWEWLPEELQKRIVEQLIATRGAGQLPLIAKLDRRSSSIAKVHLEALKTLHQPPFALSWRAILVSTSLVKLGRRIGDAGLQALSAALSKGVLASLKTLALGANKIGDAGITAFADAVGKGALASLTYLDLQLNSIGDAGMSALASACANGALDKLTVCWRLTALSLCPETSHTHSPDSDVLFDVQYTQTLCLWLGKTARWLARASPHSAQIFVLYRTGYGFTTLKKIP